MSDHDNDGSSESDTNRQLKEAPQVEAAKPVAKPLDAKAERAARLAAALRTNLRRRKMPSATSRPEPKDQN